jgi:very-short-patch-repair endonuclease
MTLRYEFYEHEQISPGPSFTKRGMLLNRSCLSHEEDFIPPLIKGDQGGFLTMLQYGKHLKQFSRRLRNEMTDAERLLWSKIRGKQLKGFQVYRQKPIGRFVVDFYCPKAKLVIELDGSQHYSEPVKAKDESRDRYMEGIGLKVLRFSDKEVFENLRGVLEEIWNRA